MKNKILIFVLLIGALFNSCKKGSEEIKPLGETISDPTSQYTSAVMLDYAYLQLQLIKATPGYYAPVAARSMAYLSLAAYESVAPGMKEYQSLEGVLSDWEDIPKPEEEVEYHWGLAVNAAQHSLMKKIYASTSDVYKSRMDTLKKTYENKYKVGIGSDAIERSIRFGTEMGLAVWEYSKTDGGHEAYNNNFPKSNSSFIGPSIWQPTGSQKRPLLPQWGEVRSFISNNSAITSSAPIPFSFNNISSFFEAALDVYQTSNNLSSTQIEIMEFWEDPIGTFTQAGHQLALVTSLINKENYRLDKTALLYLKINMAMHDTYVASWKSKYVNNIMRPQTYIQQAIDPQWMPKYETSPFPDYTAEQAALVKAISKILAAEFGENYVFEDKTLVDHPKRAYSNFENYAEEARISQLYAGVNFRMSIDNGSIQGMKVANNVLNLNFLAPIVEADSTAAFSF